MPNERGRIHEHKAPFRKQLTTPLSVYVKDAFRISTWSLSGGFVSKCATHGIRCSSAGGYQTALHYCGRPLLDWGELPVFVVEPHAPNRDVRTVTVHTNTCIVPPLIYIYTHTHTYIYIYILGVERYMYSYEPSRYGHLGSVHEALQRIQRCTTLYTTNIYIYIYTHTHIYTYIYIRGGSIPLFQKPISIRYQKICVSADTDIDPIPGQFFFIYQC